MKYVFLPEDSLFSTGKLTAEEDLSFEPNQVTPVTFSRPVGISEVFGFYLQAYYTTRSGILTILGYELGPHDKLTVYFELKSDQPILVKKDSFLASVSLFEAIGLRTVPSPQAPKTEADAQNKKKKGPSGAKTKK